MLETFIRTPEDQKSQRGKPVFYMRVKPYTTNYDFMSPSRGSNSKSRDVKVIRLAGSNKVKKNSLGNLWDMLSA